MIPAGGADTAALATVTDLQSYLGETVDSDRGNMLLEIATSIIQGETQQTLLYVADDTVELSPMDNSVVLPERPVVNVTAVAGLPAGGWTLVKDVILPGPVWSYLWMSDESIAANVGYTPLSRPLVQVTYSHGYATIPNDLRGICVSLAARLHSNPSALEQESIGNVSVRYSQVGGIGLTDLEKKVLKRYSRPARTVRLLSRSARY